MTLLPGAKLGPYEILAPLGASGEAGGMGEAWKARDTRLDRFVAVKVLPEHLASNPEALARFEREAKAVAALSHPNILGIFDVGRAEDTAYAVMELLEGESLRARLGAGALPVKQAVELATQMAQGLAAAHEKGIVHRDLKPENLWVTRDGRLKILHFGLAKQTTGLVATPEESTATFSPNHHTEQGTILGTVGYMSPDQVRGEAVDARSDIFSFGVVLYEMLGGARPFQGTSAVEVMHAILRDEPPELAVALKVPPLLECVLHRCLAKEPGRRLHSAHDLAFALEESLSLSAAGGSGDVAIKVLPVELADNPEALSRFEREARAVAQLSHPNILAIHDFGRDGETAYAVMELLEGETLRARLAHGALPARKVVELAVQFAEGLAKSCAYSYKRMTSHLFVVEGAR